MALAGDQHDIAGIGLAQGQGDGRAPIGLDVDARSDLFTLGIVFGYFADHRFWVRAVIAVSAIPVAILANGLRVASAGVAAHNFGAAGVEGLFHEFSGWVVFVIAFLMMLGLQRLLLRVVPPRAVEPRAAAVEAASA